MSEGQSVRQEPVYVLVVDDEELVRALFQSWLAAAGYRVLTAASAQEARAVVESEPVDVVLSDIRMAHQTGLDLLAWVRERDPDLPVILVTAYPTLSSAVSALRFQAYDYLVKPVSEEALLQAVGRAAAHRALVEAKRRLEEENRRYRQHLEALVAQRTAALERRTQQLMLLHQLAQELGRLELGDESAFFDRVVRRVGETFGYASVSIYTPDQAGIKVQLRALYLQAGVQGPRPGEYEQPTSEGLIGLAFRERRPVIANDVSQWPEFKPVPGLPIRSEAVIPVVIGGEVSALLNVNETRPEAFDETDKLVLTTLAEYVRIGLENLRMYAQVQEALQAREEMLNNVSHELRTPLTIIRGYAELLLEDNPPPWEEVRTMAQTILNQTKLLAHQVEQLVAMRRVQRDERWPMEVVPYAQWLRLVVTPWKQVLRESAMELEVDVPDNLGNVRLAPEHLERVIQNLLENARKFSPDGGRVQVRAWRERSWVYTAVSDQGIGIPADKLERIFEPFYQVEGGTTRRFGGMGLGLALVKEIVVRHGGEIWAESPGPGQGATFTFRLPVVSDEGETSK